MTFQQPTKTIHLIATNADGRRHEHRLEAECGVLVGSSSTCGFSLQGEGLSRFHCMISHEEGSVWVQDWASETGSYIDGVAIDGRAELRRDSTLRIGGYVIRISTEGISREDAQVDAREDSREDTVFDLDRAAIEETLRATEPSPLVLDDGLFEAEVYDRETVQLLRAEIETLQQALAQRDAELAATLESQYGDDAVEDSVRDDRGADQLLRRIDMLLEEAATRDQREALLQELLHAAEDANQAEREERNQLEAWVGDLERRLAERDQQRAAEMEALEQRVQEVESERDAALERLRTVLAEGADRSPLEAALARLEHDNQRLRSDLRDAREEVEQARAAQRESEEAHEQSLRQERIQLARERAHISRMRSDLAAKLADAEHAVGMPNHSDRDADIRTRALREHLREIHAQEQLDVVECSNDTLAARIARLWKRM